MLVTGQLRKKLLTLDAQARSTEQWSEGPPNTDMPRSLRQCKVFSGRVGGAGLGAEPCSLPSDLGYSLNVPPCQGWRTFIPHPVRAEAERQEPWGTDRLRNSLESVSDQWELGLSPDLLTPLPPRFPKHLASPSCCPRGSAETEEELRVCLCPLRPHHSLPRGRWERTRQDPHKFPHREVCQGHSPEQR